MSQSLVVIVQGTLRGEGIEIACEVLAKREDIRNNNSVFPIFLYTDCAVLGAPADTPHGTYLVSFEGHEFETVLRNGFWFPTDRADAPQAVGK